MDSSLKKSFTVSQSHSLTYFLNKNIQNHMLDKIFFKVEPGHASQAYSNCQSGVGRVGLVGWLVDFGFNGPLRQYFSLYRAVSQREGERGKKG